MDTHRKGYIKARSEQLESHTAKKSLFSSMASTQEITANSRRPRATIHSLPKEVLPRIFKLCELYEVRLEYPSDSGDEDNPWEMRAFGFLSPYHLCQAYPSWKEIVLEGGNLVNKFTIYLNKFHVADKYMFHLTDVITLFGMRFPLELCVDVCDESFPSLDNRGLRNILIYLSETTRALKLYCVPPTVLAALQDDIFPNLEELDLRFSSGSPYVHGHMKPRQKILAFKKAPLKKLGLDAFWTHIYTRGDMPLPWSGIRHFEEHSPALFHGIPVPSMFVSHFLKRCTSLVSLTFYACTMDSIQNLSVAKRRKPVTLPHLESLAITVYSDDLDPQSDGPPSRTVLNLAFWRVFRFPALKAITLDRHFFKSDQVVSVKTRRSIAPKAAAAPHHVDSVRELLLKEVPNVETLTIRRSAWCNRKLWEGDSKCRLVQFLRDDQNSEEVVLPNLQHLVVGADSITYDGESRMEVLRDLSSCMSELLKYTSSQRITEERPHGRRHLERITVRIRRFDRASQEEVDEVRFLENMCSSYGTKFELFPDRYI
ncbi:hypothetical protein NMY22_g11793 [Coprinellus aureogranulatus]|nr:hypothetical protein NMY22_g11793 [Coprinellus aureogranulatus]